MSGILFTWIDNSFFGDFVNWDVGEPNKLETEHCSQMRTSGYVRSYMNQKMEHSGKWNNFKCDEMTETFFCKRNY